MHEINFISTRKRQFRRNLLQIAVISCVLLIIVSGSTYSYLVQLNNRIISADEQLLELRSVIRELKQRQSQFDKIINQQQPLLLLEQVSHIAKVVLSLLDNMQQLPSASITLNNLQFLPSKIVVEGISAQGAALEQFVNQLHSIYQVVAVNRVNLNNQGMAFKLFIVPLDKAT